MAHILLNAQETTVALDEALRPRIEANQVSIAQPSKCIPNVSLQSRDVNSYITVILARWRNETTACLTFVANRSVV